MSIFLLPTFSPFHLREAVPVLGMQAASSSALRPKLFSEQALEQAATAYQRSLSEDILNSLNGRFERGYQMAFNGSVLPLDPSGQLFTVQSATSSEHYQVSLEPQSCACKDFQRGFLCKHLIAANIISIAMHFQIDHDQPSFPQHEEITWAITIHNGQRIPVEIVNISGEMAVVRALPNVTEDGKLVPQFPFASGSSSMETVSANSLSHVKVFG